MKIRLGHSPDPDDAFMFYGLATGAVDGGGFTFEHVLRDIQTLNEQARTGELEITAISAAAYPAVRGLYDLTRCGGSFGDNYGPMIVARREISPEELPGVTIAIPGTLTSAYLALRLYNKAVQVEVMPFDQILPAVAEGRAQAGLLIHEGQLTYAQAGLKLVADLGQWWFQKTGGLPLPLGVNAIRRDLGQATCRKLSDTLLESIRYSLAHRDEAVAYALGFGRGLTHGLADRFVGMYVNDLTVDAGPRGRKGIEEFLAAGHAAGLIENALPLRFV